MRYNSTSLAYNIEEYNEVDELVSEARKTGVKTKKVSGLFLLVCAIYVVSMVSSLLIKTANINEQKNELNAIQAQYNEILNENKKLEVAINSQIDLRKVEEIAIAQLGMNKPKKSQTVYVNTEPKDYGEVLAAQANNDEGSNVIALLVKTLGGIFVYSK